MKKTTKEVFIALCDKKYPNLYKYDLLPADFGQSEQVTLICKKHGEFETTYEQLRQNKEPLCWRCRAKSKDELIRIVEMRYPNIYDFSEVPDYFFSTDMFTVKYKDYDDEEEETNYRKLTSYITKKYIPKLESFKITREEFIDYCEERWPGKYDYSRVPIRIREDTMLILWCNIHHVFITTNFRTIKQRKYICAYCYSKISDYVPQFTSSDKKRIISRDLFISEAEERYGKDVFDYEFVPQYIRTSDKITIRCITHNALFDVRYVEFTTRLDRPCPICQMRYERQYQTKEKLLKIAAERFPDKPYDYSLLPDTCTSADTLHIKCLKHNIIFDVKYKNFLRQKEICPECMKMTKEELMRILIERNDTNYDFSEVPDTFGANDRLIFTCLTHQNTFSIPYTEITQRRIKLCSICAKIEELEENGKKFLQNAIEKYGDRFDYSKVNYQGVFSEIEIYCHEHDRYFITTPAAHLRNTGCPDCMSHIFLEGLSNDVADMLDRHGYGYEREQPFVWLRYKRPMRLDVYIPSLNIAIEAHGEQHFRQCDWYDKGDVNSFLTRVYRDITKYNQCKEHGITILYYSDKKYVESYPLGTVYTDLEELHQAILRISGSK